MNQNNIPEQLENKHKDVQMSGNTPTGDSVDVTADTGASVNAPVLTGNIITGPVNISYILNPPVHNTPTRINEGSTAEDSKVDIHHYGNISLRLKNNLQEDYKWILVGNSQTGHRENLKDIPNLYVVENETGRTVSDHDVIQTESTNRFTANDTPIQCNDIFKDYMGRQNRKVLTMGIAGVGKTVSVNKFILDWAEGKENQDILFVFPLPFRRLNLIKKQYSLMGLLNKYFFRCPEELPSLPEGDGKVMFIFDGLDECRFPLEFKKGDRFTDVHKKTTVSKIVTNLIKRHLVPSALIWITSRPAAAGLIPRDYIDQVTEVRGFNDEQKEQYFIENSSPQVAGNIIRHIRKSRSLYIMCHIPVFCWISLTVLEPLLTQERIDKTPTTLTEMYTSFLLCQQQQMKTKHHDGPEPKPKAKTFDQILLKLGKLAFKQLEKDNLIFYKEDLEECGLDVSEGSVYSGLFTQIFQMEKAVSEREVYSFVHLGVQEFLAALYVFFKYKYYGRNAFLQYERRKLTLKLSKTSLFDLHKSAVTKSLKSENGHLDLFLWFLLGLSLESNQSDLKELLPGLDLKTENVKDIADYIKQTIEKEISVERTINLFHCLSELKDDFKGDIQNYLISGNLSAQNLSSARWSAQEFVRQISEETQEKFELQKYRRSDEALRLPANQNTRGALVDHGGQIRMTAGPRQFAYDLTLDPNTANTRLILYEENRKVKHVKDHQLYPDHPERFADVPQVLSRESLAGCCYWDVEWSGWVNISVSYKKISRKGGSEDCKFGSNDKSWSLFCTDNGFTVCHNNTSSDLPAPSPRSDRVGVYVDVSAGTLSFYSVSDTHTLTHLHTFNTTFTEPLYAGFGVDYYSSVSLCDIKQPPVRNNSKTHTTGFSDSKPSGLNIHPLLNCQSCVHIADSDQWVQIEPSACTDEGGSKFRVSTDPGRYECVRTRMRWVCDYVVTLQYCTVDGHFLNTELERLRCNRIAPVIDVTVISGKLEEVHLPHYACLGESDPSLKDAVKVLTVKDKGITTEPVQLTRFHAKIVKPSFSITTLIISWKKQVNEHCDLLLYMRSKDPLILHVYFFPFDDCAKEKVEKNEKSSYPIPHPRPDRPFRMKKPHILDVPGALTIHPKEGITLRRETPPNYFKVMTRLENDLQMTLSRKKEVWTATILKDELYQIHLKREEPHLNSDQIHPKRDEPRLNSETDKALFFDNHWPDLIQGVKNVGIIADKLCQQKIIHEEQYSEITKNLTSQESMRKICDIIRKHNDAAKAKFISVLQKEELYLLEHLCDSTP